MKNVTLLTVLVLAAFSSCASKSQNIREKKADILYQAGTESLMDGQFTDALASLQQSVKLEPNSANTWNNLGLAYAGKNEYKKAEESWKRALKVDPKWTDARSNLGALYVQTKRYNEAEKQLKIALEDLTYENSAQVHYNLALTYLTTRRPLPAEQQLKLAVKAEDTYCPAWFRLGKLQKERGDFSAAEESFNKSVAGVCFKNPEAHYEISSLLLKSKNVVGARAKLLEIIQIFPETSWAQKAEDNLSMLR
jgi:type IV pilus assembly protein PilF